MEPLSPAGDDGGRAVTRRPVPVAPVLGLDPDELASCVQCGMCLPHCPTFRVTGDELQSPRGRIALMRRVDAGTGVVDHDFLAAIESCVQCRGCEPACPSGVPFGHLMEQTREAVSRPPWWQRAGFLVLAHHRLLLAGSSALAVAQRARLVPRRLASALPRRLPIRRPPLRSTGTDVWLLTGCVMDAWQRDVHAAAVRVLTSAGVGVAVAGVRCCGALHVHAGLGRQGRALARRALAAFPGDAPIVVDAAGCGAWLKEHSDRVVDIHEYLAGLALPPARRRLAEPVAVQDPCHLRHVQRAHQHVRTVLRPYVEHLVELDDEGLCCGAGGAYSALHPDEASRIRARKLAAIDRSGARLVASANPGCAIHLAATGVRVVHPVELIDQALQP